MKILLISLLLGYFMAPAAGSLWRSERTGRLWSYEFSRYVVRGESGFDAAVLWRKGVLIGLPLFFGILLLHGPGRRS